MTLTYSKHKAILLQMLKDIYSDPVLATHLGFKGGTAAMLFYGLNRHSVDLDFDLLEEDKASEVIEKLQKIIASYGRIVESRMKRFSLFTVMSYAATEPRIKIEVNRRNLDSSYKLETVLGISMLVMVKADMFAHKLMAMYERIGKTSRDIFDVRFFAKNGWEINTAIVEQRAQLPFTTVLEQCIKLIEKMDNRHILDGLGELLSEAQKDSTRATLKTDTVFLLRVMLDSIKS